MSSETFDILIERLDRIEAVLSALADKQVTKEWYSTTQVANLLGKAEYTVREWCRLGRISAKKLSGGRGNEGEWRISHDELVRYQGEGLLPLTPQSVWR